MSVSIPNLGRDGVIKNQPLEESLKLSGPYNVASAPNAYSFARLRDIEIDWEEVFKKAGFPLDTTNANSLRDYVLRNWGASNPPQAAEIDANMFALEADWPAYEHQPTSIQTTIRSLSTGFHVFRTRHWREFRALPKASEVIEHTTGCVLAFKTQNGSRYFKPVIVDEATGAITYPLVSDFSPGSWNDTWRKIDGLLQVFHPGTKPVYAAAQEVAKDAAKEAAKTDFPFTEIVRADAALILQQWKFLESEEAIAGALREKATEISNQMKAAPLREIPVLQEQYRELTSYGRSIDEKKKSLADAAADLGYHLFTKPTTVKYVDKDGQDDERTLGAGTLFRRSLKTQSWTTYQTVTKTRRRIFSKRTYTYQIPVQHSKTFEFYEEAFADNDPWIEVLDFYKRQGYSVFFFIDTVDGLRAADGSRPHDVFQRCEEDEAFRKRCVIGLPVRELSIVGEEFLIGYSIITRPTPEAIVSEFPSLELDESLSYRFTWTGVALGEMAATIPLSPGEEREVTIKTSKQFKSTRTERTSSLIDVTRIDRSDFETVFEKEVQKEKEKSSTFSASASASYGVASGSANFSKSTRTKDVARQLNRSVQKASQEVNRRSRDERTLEVSESVETSESTSTSFKVSNINSGTTLNVTFYRIMNSFQSVLRLDAGQLLMRSGRSYFTANDLRDATRFGDIANPREAVERLLDHLIASGEFPFDISELASIKNAEKRELVVDGIISAIRKSNQDNFSAPGTEKESSLRRSLASASFTDLHQKFSQSDALFAMSAMEADLLLDRACTVDCAKSDEEDRSNLINALRLTRDSAIRQETQEVFEQPIEDVSFFAYDSGGLYADVIRGTNEGVEPYAEKMRSMEVEKAAAEIRLIDARANYLRSRAGSNAGYLDYLDEAKLFCTAISVLLLNADNHLTVRVQVVPPGLPREGWIAVFADGLGEFPTQRILDGGVLEFLLPVRFFTHTKLHNWSEVDFEAKFSLKHPEYKLRLTYRKTPEAL